MPENLKCPIDRSIYNRHRQHRLLSLGNYANDSDQWHTSTQDAFPAPKVKEIFTIGRRKDLIMKELNKQALQTLANEMNPKDVVNDEPNPSEYIESFCDPAFIPFMDKSDTDVNELMKYPLYATNNQTFYKEQIDRGTLKSRTEISNLNEPFRRNSSFTTSPDLAVREPTGGF